MDDGGSERGDMRQSLVGRTNGSRNRRLSDFVSRVGSRSMSSMTPCDATSTSTAPPASMGMDYLGNLARRNLVITITCTSCMLLLYGYDFGITAWSVLYFKAAGQDEVSKVYSYLDVHGEALGMVVAAGPIGAFVITLLGTKVASQRRGRKAEIRLANLLCVVGATLEAFVGLAKWDNVLYVLAFAFGRFMCGLGFGLAIRCGPMYLRETVKRPFLDAALVSLKLSIVVGIIISYILGGLLTNPTVGYLGMWVVAGISLACLSVMPESPMYMLLDEERFPEGEILDALGFANPAANEDDVHSLRKEVLTEVLAYTPGHPSFGGGVVADAGHGPASYAHTGTSTAMISPVSPVSPVSPSAAASHSGSGGVGDVMAHVPSRTNGKEGREGKNDPIDNSQTRGAVAMAVKNLPSLSKAPGMRAAVVLTSGLMFFEQASGMTAVLYYGGVFLNDISIIAVDWGLALLGLVQLAVAIAVMFALNPIGRKPLVVYGLAGLSLSAFMLVVGGYLGLSASGRWWALLGLYGFTVSYSTSLGALVWVLVSEVFPTCHRAQAISIVATAHFGTSAVVVVVLPLLQDIGGYAAMFMCFFLVSIAANIFAHLYMVETRGLTAVEIQRALTLKAGRLTAQPETMTMFVSV